MTNQENNLRKRDPLTTVLVVIVGLSLLAAFLLLIRGYPSSSSDMEITIPAEAIPGIGIGENQGSAGDDGLTITIPAMISADDLRELAGALAAVITALTGLFGIVATQVWRGREENRTDKSHALTLEKERLDLERERLQLERDRMDLERQRDALVGKP